MKKVWFAAVVCMALGAAPHARADEASHRAAVVELFKLMNMEQMLQQSMDAALDAQIKMNPALVKFAPKMRAFFAKYMSWKSLEEDFVRIYKKSFNEAELKELLVFYRTPVGQKTIREMPALMQQGVELGAGRVQQHMPELMQMLQAETVNQAGKLEK